jgi:hypothetical protein
MDEEKLKKLLSASIPFAEEYEVQWKGIPELDGDRRLLDVEEYGITSTCQIRERLFVVEKVDVVKENTIVCRTVRKKHYGDDESVDTPGNPIGSTLTGKETIVIVAHSSFLTQPQGPHNLKRVLEAYR